MTHIERLTYLNAALACMHPGAASATAIRLLQRAGIENARAFVWDGATVESVVQNTIAAAEACGLLPIEVVPE